MCHLQCGWNQSLPSLSETLQKNCSVNLSHTHGQQVEKKPYLFCEDLGIAGKGGVIALDVIMAII